MNQGEVARIEKSMTSRRLVSLVPTGTISKNFANDLGETLPSNNCDVYASSHVDSDTDMIAQLTCSFHANAPFARTLQLN